MNASLPLVILLAASGQIATAKTQGQLEPWLILPGQSVGYTSIGEQMADVYQVVKQPNGPGWDGDTAMGHQWGAWIGATGHELDIYWVRGPSDSAAHPDEAVRQIRTNSPSFHTPEGLGIGTDLATIIQKSRRLVLAMSKGSMRLFDSPTAGIAFEIQREHCVAIVVHRPNVGVLSEYMPFRAYWKPAKQTAH